MNAAPWHNPLYGAAAASIFDAMSSRDSPGGRPWGWKCPLDVAKIAEQNGSPKQEFSTSTPHDLNTPAEEASREERRKTFRQTLSTAGLQWIAAAEASSLSTLAPKSQPEAWVGSQRSNRRPPRTALAGSGTTTGHHHGANLGRPPRGGPPRGLPVANGRRLKSTAPASMGRAANHPRPAAHCRTSSRGWVASTGSYVMGIGHRGHRPYLWGGGRVQVRVHRSALRNHLQFTRNDPRCRRNPTLPSDLSSVRRE